jgi:hypothetical protein
VVRDEAAFGAGRKASPALETGRRTPVGQGVSLVGLAKFDLLSWRRVESQESLDRGQHALSVQKAGLDMLTPIQRMWQEGNVGRFGAVHLLNATSLGLVRVSGGTPGERSCSSLKTRARFAHTLFALALIGDS